MPGKWRAMVAIAMAGVMQLLDVTVVNIALPDIERDLDASFNELRWVIDASALTLASTVLIYGSLGDRLGRRRVFTTGMLGFSLLSLACGLAWSALALDILRAAQGIAAGAMLATALALIGATYSGRERNTALAVWGAGISGALAVGPLVGGALVEVVGWRSVFLLNVPIGLLAVALVARGVPESRDPSATGRPDFAGVAAIAGSMTLVLLALFNGNDSGWGSALILGLFGGSVLLVLVFILIESRVAQPMLDLALLRTPSTVGAFVGMLTIAASVFALFTFLIFYIQNALSYSALETGLILLPLSLTGLLSALLAGRLANVLPMRALLASALAIAGLGMLLLRQVDVNSDWPTILLGGIVMQIGTGAVNPLVAGAALGAAPRARSGMASGLNATARYVGLAVGVAGLGTILETQVEEQLTDLLGAPESQALTGVVSTGNVEGAVASVPADAGAEVAAAASAAFVAGLDEIFLVGALLAFLGAAVVLAFVRGRDMHREAAVAPRPTPPSPRAPGVEPVGG